MTEKLRKLRESAIAVIVAMPPMEAWNTGFIAGMICTLLVLALVHYMPVLVIVGAVALWMLACRRGWR